MATRYAGDYFGIAVDDSTDASTLMEYFPDLRETYRKKAKTEPQRPEEQKNSRNEPRLTGNLRAAKQFAGFKTFEAPD